MRLQLLSLQRSYPHDLNEVDVESDSQLSRRLAQEIPVVQIDDRQIKAPVTHQQLVAALAAASPVGPKSGLESWLVRHYLAVVNSLIFTYVGIPVLAPVLMQAGLTTPASWIYKIYSYLCHQFSFRSFFLFGPHPDYPLQSAGLVGPSLEHVTGWMDLANPLSPQRLLAREFIGSPQLGWKIALCERDLAIYGAMLLFGIIFAVTGRRIKALPWWGWLVLGVLPIGLDGVSQLVSQFDLAFLKAFLPFRESTPLLRVLTGGLFGWCTAWLAVPVLEELMALSPVIKAAAGMQSVPKAEA